MARLTVKRFEHNCALVSLALAVLVGGQASAEQEIDLAAFDIEDLLSMEVTSISKKSERAFEAPAAAFVITNEDIRRSGLRSVPELLRMVPGVQVAQLNASQYAITVRGFNGNFSDKLLVLIDGRSIYTPLFAGVWWDVQELPLADIDRIEVIRGPGGTIWGANAVNGVINIVTKSAAETQGWHVEVGIGNYERGGSGTVRYGGSLAENVDFRVYLKQFDREKFKDADQQAFDAWDQIRTGFRLDAKIGDFGEFTLHGDLYDGSTNAVVASAQSKNTVGGGNVLARYTHTFSDTHNASVQIYYDRTDRHANILTYELDTFDLELEHRIAPLPWLDLVWGAEYQHLADDSKTRNPVGFDTSPAGLLAALGLTEVLNINPASRDLDLFSGFLQAEARAWEDKVRLTLGTKLEDNDTSGFEVQPSVRFAFVPDEAMTVWGSIARAVRTPSRSNDDLSSIAETDLMRPIQTSGNRDIEAEDLLAYEAGIRVQPSDWLHLDLAAYYNVYDDLVVQNVTGLRPPVSTPIGPIIVADTTAANKANATAWGFEFFARVRALENHPIVKEWWIDATYSYIDVDLDLEGTADVGSALGGVLGEDSTVRVGRREAHHTIGLRSHMNLFHDLDLDLSYYYVSRVKQVGDAKVSSYHRFDLRTAWHPSEHVELSFSAENLFESAHREWNEVSFIGGSQVPRTVYGKITLDF